MRDTFQLHRYGTSATKEILSGLTTFVTLSYIFFVNPSIMSGAGMPVSGVFAATVIATGVCSILMGIVANVPFAMAPGMGFNTFFVYGICQGLHFRWQEGLAIVCFAGLLNVLIMSTRLRKVIVRALPDNLKYAFAIGIGLFICYVGLKNAGVLTFTLLPGQYQILDSGMIVGGSGTVPGLKSLLSWEQIVALIGFGAMLFLLSLEKKNGETYLALPVGILVATFVGVPTHVTTMGDFEFFDFSVFSAIGDVFLACFGEQGLLSILADPQKVVLAGVITIVQLFTHAIVPVGTILAIGDIAEAKIFSGEEMKEFVRPCTRNRLDKALLCNSFGGLVGALCGTVAATSYIESITGIITGGRTGLTAVTVGVLALLCLPLSAFFGFVPPAAVAPALVIVGAYMLSFCSRIDWKNFEEAFPAYATIACIPFSFDLLYGLSAGVLSHVLIRVVMGNGRQVHPLLYVLAALFLIVIGVKTTF